MMLPPQLFSIVPSSIRVTFELAIFFPKSSLKTDIWGAIEVASNPWPHASWNITAPKPGAIITGISPPFIFIASNFFIALLLQFNTFSSKFTSSKKS